MDPLLKVDNISCRYDSTEVFNNLSLQVSEGSIACLLGPSGCGKTTALRAIAGFENIHSGSISLAGKTLSTASHCLPPEERQVGMVFQDYALFPHLSVADNIAFGLHRLGKTEKQQQTNAMLALIRMQDYANSWPHQLSGGQQQRVALARALAPQPRLLLMDEPFSNLDTELRRSLSLEVRDIIKQHGTTAILVTHDQSEAFNVADEIGVMDQGKLLQWGSAQDIYHHPSSAFVASFVSQGQLISGTVRANQQVETALFGLVTLAQGTAGLPANTPVDLLLRPWNVVLDPAGSCHARIISQQFNGAITQTSLQAADDICLISYDPGLAALPADTNVTLNLSPQHLRVFPRR